MRLDSPARELADLQGAYGRLFTLGAQALQHEDGAPKHSREAVRIALQGHGENIRLRPVRLARIEAGMRMDNCRHALALRGIVGADATRLMLLAVKESKTAVEQEWCCSLPVVAAPL